LGEAAALLFGPHEVRRIDAGRCGDRRFLHMAGAGLDSRFFERTSRGLKRRIGWLAYLPAATLALRHPPARFTIEVDGQSMTVTSPLVLVANGGSVIAPVMRLHPDVRVDDGWLDVLIFTATDPAAIARTVLRFLTGSLARSPFVVHRRGHQVHLSTEPDLPVQLDGDVVTRTPVTFTVEPLGIGVIAPFT
jgi:diacylglycerol kinase family enzyme